MAADVDLDTTHIAIAIAIDSDGTSTTSTDTDQPDESAGSDDNSAKTDARNDARNDGRNDDTDRNDDPVGAIVGGHDGEAPAGPPRRVIAPAPGRCPDGSGLPPRLPAAVVHDPDGLRPGARRRAPPGAPAGSGGTAGPAGRGRPLCGPLSALAVVRWAPLTAVPPNRLPLAS